MAVVAARGGITQARPDARPFFVLRGAAPTQAELSGSLTDDARGATRLQSGLGAARKASNRMKMPDANAIEHMLSGRRTVHVPTFSMISEQGVEYPESTSDHFCQWDHYPIVWRPLGMPVKRYTIAKKPQYVCVRWFCSLECMRMHYKQYCRQDPVFADTLRYIDEMHRAILKFLNQPHEPLQDALDWNLLRGVGSGRMDIDEFRSAYAERYVKEFTFLMTKGIEVYTRHAAAS